MENTATSRFMNMTNIAESPSTATQSTTSSFFSSMTFKVIAVILILALLGLNIFYYLADATDTTSDILQPLFSLFGYSSGDAVKQTVKTSAKGTNVLVDSTANVIKSSAKITEDIVDDTIPSDPNKQTTKSQVAQDKLNKRPKLEDNVKASNEEDDNVLTINSISSKSSEPIGYCYIGEDRGYRTCIDINDSNLCMSGEIFPTQDVCVNPNLR